MPTVARELPKTAVTVRDLRVDACDRARLIWVARVYPKSRATFGARITRPHPPTTPATNAILLMPLRSLPLSTSGLRGLPTATQSSLRSLWYDQHVAAPLSHRGHGRVVRGFFVGASNPGLSNRLKNWSAPSRDWPSV